MAHAEMLEVVSGLKAPLPEIIDGVQRLKSDIERLLKSASSEDIRRDLEAIALKSDDLAQDFASFESEWNRLAPLIESWSEADDLDLLLEYQGKAENVVRATNKAAYRDLQDLIRMKEGLDNQGSNMTQRRNIQTQLASSINDFNQQWGPFFDQAVQIVAAENKTLLGP